MYFRLDTISSAGHTYSVGTRLKSDNAITVIVGPNGVGKTRLLSGLAYVFTNRRNFDKSGFPAVQASTKTKSLSEPVRVVAQTFSPFSRFPRERSKPPTLDQYINPIDDQYSAVGFTRNMGIRGSVSKDAVSRVLRKLFTKPEHASTLRSALTSLGFMPLLDLEFEFAPLSRNLNIFAKGAELKTSIKKMIDGLENRRLNSTEELRLVREIDSQTNDRLVDLLSSAIEVIQPTQMVTNQDKAKREMYRFELDLNSDLTFPSNLLWSIIVLSRVGLIRLADCYITPNKRVGNYFRGVGLNNRFSLTDASSGEQQLLSSLFGIVAEAENNSLILIDEPELSLHPEWQTRFLDLLVGVLNPFSGCHIVIATHSPLIAQRAGELELELLKLGEGKSLPLEYSAVASVDQTLLEVFDLAVKDSTYVSRLILSFVMGAESDPSLRTESKARLNELHKLYSETIPFDRRTVDLINDALDILSD